MQVIQSRKEEGYWNNEDGWGCLETATQFEELQACDLPIGPGDVRIVGLEYAKENRVDLGWCE